MSFTLLDLNYDLKKFNFYIFIIIIIVIPIGILTFLVKEANQTQDKKNIKRMKEKRRRGGNIRKLKE